jgi:hypothetical protein
MSGKCNGHTTRYVAGQIGRREQVQRLGSVSEALQSCPLQSASTSQTAEHRLPRITVSRQT